MKKFVLILLVFTIAGCMQPDKQTKVTLEAQKTNDSLNEAISKQKVKEEQELLKAKNEKTVKELSKFFRTKKDEFSPDQKTWIEPKSAPNFTNRNGLYCYFETRNGVANNLRFRLQYYAEDWLFFTRVQFSIDGKPYEYIPNNTETDNGDGGMIWEWFDESVTSSDKELLSALANAKTAKMKLIGRQYHEIKSISKDQINNIKRTLDYYNALGGSF